MSAREWLKLTSLRSKMCLAALGGLITTAVLTALLLLTADIAEGVVGAARDTQERLRVYSHLSTAANKYQEASYQAVRLPDGLTGLPVIEARTRMENLLAEARRLPALDERDRAVQWQIHERGQAVLTHFDNADDLVEKIDQKWDEGGAYAAMEEVDRVSQPINALQATLQAEIRRVDWLLASTTSHAQSQLHNASVAALVGLLVALAFSAAVVALLQLRLRPGLRRLEDGATAFGQGDLDHRIALQGKDELSHLSNAFDRMAKTLSQKQQQLREIQFGLELAVAERTSELRKANEELSTVNERRRAFLADISHELRTPLTIIRGETQVAMRVADQHGFEPYEVFERILKQTRDLSRMVDDLFIIARAQAGVLPLEIEQIDLQQLALDIASDFDTLASERGGSIRALAGPENKVPVDKSRLRRAMAALVENALKHCHPRVNIEIKIHSGQQFVSVAICDDGPGVNFHEADKLFERFRRGETRGEGSGLGLSLVSALVEAHGGHAALEPNPGGGTRAVLRFPLPQQHEKAA